VRAATVLSYYSLPRQPGRETPHVRAFVAALAADGWREGQDFTLAVWDVESEEEAAATARRVAASGVDLIHACGTALSVAAARATRRIPIVYYGSHPGGVGRQELAADNVTGQEIHIPLTSSYKGFRFLPRLVPRMRKVWVPFFERSIFVSRHARALHRAARERKGRPVWLSGEAPRIGFPHLAGLAYVIGVEYRELVYTASAEIAPALAGIDPADGLLMLFQEPFYPPGAVEQLLAAAAEHRLPLVWNNNPPAAALGALAGVGVDFVAMGRAAGQAAARILAGTAPRDLPRSVHKSCVAWINLDTAETLGLSPDMDVLKFFNRKIRHCSGSATT